MSWSEIVSICFRSFWIIFRRFMVLNLWSWPMSTFTLLIISNFWTRILKLWRVSWKQLSWGNKKEGLHIIMWLCCCYLRAGRRRPCNIFKRRWTWYRRRTILTTVMSSLWFFRILLWSIFRKDSRNRWSTTFKELTFTIWSMESKIKLSWSWTFSCWLSSKLRKRGPKTWRWSSLLNRGRIRDQQQLIYQIRTGRSTETLIR